MKAYLWNGHLRWVGGQVAALKRSAIPCRRAFLALATIFLVTACATPTVQDPGPSWDIRFSHPVEFQNLIDEKLLVVGTERHLFGIDPRNGRRLWRVRNLHATSGDLMALGDAPYFLVNDATGGAFDDSDTYVLALDRLSGRLLWESQLLHGRALQGTIDPVSGLLFLVNVREAHGDDRGFFSGVLPGKGLGSGFKRKPRLNAFEVSTGRLLWSRSFDKEVILQPAYRAARGGAVELQFTRPFTLDPYHPPVVGTDKICVTYAGVQCYDTWTGEPRWAETYDVVEGKLARSYANPIIAGGVLYASGNNRIRAYQEGSGEPLWSSRRFDLIPELLLDDDAVYGQLGGRFFDIQKEEWVWEGDFGAVALKKSTGKTLWKYTKAKGSVTNLLIFGERVWLADKKRLIALDRRTGRRLIHLRHDLKDRPVFIALNDQKQILLISKSEVAAFDPEIGKRQWYVFYPPVGPSAWKRFSAGLLHTSGTILKVSSFLLANIGGLLPAVPSLSLPLGGQINLKLIDSKRILKHASGGTGRAFVQQANALSGTANSPFTNLKGGHQYFITKLRSDKQALAMVNLSTGNTDRLILLPSSHPNLVIDESNQKIYQAFADKLIALPM